MNHLPLQFILPYFFGQSFRTHFEVGRQKPNFEVIIGLDEKGLKDKIKFCKILFCMISNKSKGESLTSFLRVRKPLNTQNIMKWLRGHNDKRNFVTKNCLRFSSYQTKFCCVNMSLPFYKIFSY